MSADALDQAFRDASARITGALAARYRDLDLAEDAFAEACVRAAQVWPAEGAPADHAAWLYRAAQRCALDILRRRRTRERLQPEPPPLEPTAEDMMADDANLIPDERLRLIFVCCHPAVAADARAALTLRLICGLSVAEIARAFLVAEPTMAQRLVRAKRKIGDAGVPFEIPQPEFWPERLDAVLSTIEIAYAKAHEDAAGLGTHASYANDMLALTRVLAELLPREPDVLALAAMIRFAEARRPARLDEHGAMVPLSQQDPVRWRRPLIEEGERYLQRAANEGGDSSRVLHAAIHSVWCARRSLNDPAPWKTVLHLYDALLSVRDDSIVRLNRAVALAEVRGVAEALADVAAIDGDALVTFLPYHAVRADLLRRNGQMEAASSAYRVALALNPGPAERLWLERQAASLQH
ncbi:MAG: RNA polymerase sigma factor [Proteobacteria bacterium]|nr:RNA polymerase sigma factor [Pseudomonadota bacterium]